VPGEAACVVRLRPQPLICPPRISPPFSTGGIPHDLRCREQRFPVGVITQARMAGEPAANHWGWVRRRGLLRRPPVPRRQNLPCPCVWDLPPRRRRDEVLVNFAAVGRSLQPESGGSAGNPRLSGGCAATRAPFHALTAAGRGVRPTTPAACTHPSGSCRGRAPARGTPAPARRERRGCRRDHPAARRTGRPSTGLTDGPGVGQEENPARSHGLVALHLSPLLSRSPSEVRPSATKMGAPHAPLMDGGGASSPG
jgi:hypothetical protein